MRPVQLSNVILVAVFLVATPRALFADDKDTIAGLIADLDSDTAAQRDNAAQQLIELGANSVGAIEVAANMHASLEVRSRAANILRRLAGCERDDNELGLKLVWCPPGKFTMGTLFDEGPKKGVEVELPRGYWIGRYEVTQGEWKAVMESTPWSKDTNSINDNRCAVSHVGWYEARDFCRLLTEKERAAGRLNADVRYDLPTDAEWEYACRAGTASAYFFSNDVPVNFEQAVSAFAIYAGNKERDFAHTVGTKKPNAWGLHDMQGNVSEWCRDVFRRELAGGVDPGYFPDDPIAAVTNPQERATFARDLEREMNLKRSRLPRSEWKTVPKVPLDRVVRGTSWRHEANKGVERFRSAYRVPKAPEIGNGSSTSGFRVVLVRDTKPK